MSTRPPAPTVGDVVAEAVRTLVRSLTELEPAVRADVPDSVHRMRVVARRLRAVLRTYRHVLDPARTRTICRELAWAARELGAARDAEIVAEALVAEAAEVPADEIVGPIATALPEAAALRYAAARFRVLACLDSSRYRALRAELAAGPPPGTHAGRPADAELPHALRHAVRGLRRARESAERAEGAERDLALHELRKQVKRLRYATDLAVAALGAPAVAVLEALTPLQRLLGDRQDTVVIRTVLRELAAEADARDESAFTYGVLHARQTARAAALESELDAVLRRADDRLRAALPG